VRVSLPADSLFLVSEGRAAPAVTAAGPRHEN
jgi:hypothetical protein